MSSFGINEASYSSLANLLDVTAYVKKFIMKPKKNNVSSGTLTADEIEDA